MENLLERITLNPDICHGKPCIRNKRYPVSLILDLPSAGMREQEILEDYLSRPGKRGHCCLSSQLRFSRIVTLYRQGPG